MLDETAGALRTEFRFTLPCGYIDLNGDLHRTGVMRLATALDEVQPLRDPRVEANAAYVAVLLLSRVVTHLGSISPVTPAVIERLFAADFAYLQALYMRLNGAGERFARADCPDCGSQFAVDLVA